MGTAPPLIEEIRRQAPNSPHLQNSLIAGAAMEGGLVAPFPAGDAGWSRGPFQIKFWRWDRTPEQWRGHPLTPLECEDPATAVAYAIKYEQCVLPDGRTATCGLGYGKNAQQYTNPIDVAYQSERPAHYYSDIQQQAAWVAINKYGTGAVPPPEVYIQQPPWIWVGAHPNNYLVGRGGISLEAVVWHVTTGGMPGPWFNNPSARASTNFAVSKTGLLEAYVKLEDMAYAHGSVEVAYDQALPLIQANWGYNPNLWAASIEFEGTEAEVNQGIVPTAQQSEMAVWVTAWLFNQQLWDPSTHIRPPADRNHVMMHRDISPNSRTCPVWGEDIHGRMISMVQQMLTPGPTPIPPIPPQRDYFTESLNLLTVQRQELLLSSGRLANESAVLQIQADNIQKFLNDVAQGG